MLMGYAIRQNDTKWDVVEVHSTPRSPNALFDPLYIVVKTYPTNRQNDASREARMLAKQTGTDYKGIRA